MQAAELRIGEGNDAIERVEVHIPRDGFSPHRHDTYAIGVTLSGVQAFRYRGVERRCLPGQCHILHPDEVHDGRCGDGGGFRYRIAYIDPAVVQRAIGGMPLPFAADPVVTLAPAQFRLLAPLWDLTDPLDAMREAELSVAVADILMALSSPGPRPGKPLALQPLLRVRELLASAAAEDTSAEAMESVARLDRWTLARQFRAAFGTSPTRFRTMRQLDAARRLMARGASLADASQQAGFFDQSHMSRKFKRAYGLTPGRWAASLRNAAPAATRCGSNATPRRWR